MRKLLIFSIPILLVACGNPKNEKPKEVKKEQSPAEKFRGEMSTDLNPLNYMLIEGQAKLKSGLKSKESYKLQSVSLMEGYVKKGEKEESVLPVQLNDEILLSKNDSLTYVLSKQERKKLISSGYKLDGYSIIYYYSATNSYGGRLDGKFLVNYDSDKKYIGSTDF